MKTLRTVVSGLALFTVSGLALALQVEGGTTHTAILDDAGDLYISGDNTAGELGHALVRQGFHKVTGNEKFTHIDASVQLTLAVTDTGKVKAFGKGYGVGVYLPLPQSRQAVLSSSNVISLSMSGTVQVYTWRTKTVVTMALQDIVQIDAGEGFAVALDKNGRVYSWGTSAAYGQLGHGDFNPLTSPVIIEGLPFITQIKSATYHTVVLTRTGEAYVFGYNRYGRLGLGHETNTAIPQKVELASIKDIAAGNGQSLFLTEDGKVYGTGYTSYQDNTRSIYGNTVTPTWFASSSADYIFAGEGDQEVIVKGKQFKGLGNSRSTMLSLVVNNDSPETRQFTDMMVPSGMTINVPIEMVDEVPASCPVVYETVVAEDPRIAKVAVLYKDLDSLIAKRLTMKDLVDEKNRRLQVAQTAYHTAMNAAKGKKPAKNAVSPEVAAKNAHTAAQAAAMNWFTNAVKELHSIDAMIAIEAAAIQAKIRSALGF